ncbi:MAG TPA: adenylate/guanylate cyclase domain-containing protein [Candidatus Baltobacteraceae bacterium]|nr:adenylate/guanylate cyclase domain-containing protein [Candidatus Baltobacteraceae bacterium]
MTEGGSKVPTGTVTFLFSDIEGSTQRWDANRQAMQAAVRRHDALMRSAIETNGGYIFKTIGDAFCAAFRSSEEALAATVEAQRRISTEDWNEVGGLRVRMAIHTGIADERDNDYYGPTVNRVARLLAIGHGGQVLVSGAARSLIEERIIPGITLLDMGVHRLKDLSTPEHVFQLGADGLATEFPPLHSLDLVPNNLPASLNALVGRDREAAEIEELVASSRLVTLVGSGGIGKTRIAVQVAADLAEADGVWFVDLASTDDPALVPSAIAAVFKIADEGGEGLLERLTAALRTKKLLLVLDNCEQIVAGVAETAEALLRSCQGVRILATSREPLGIAGEEVYRLPLLTLPSPGENVTAERAIEYGAVALFVARARSSQKSFSLTDENATLVADIVRRLDGIALAIELAAARVKLLSVAQLAQKLDDRLKLLTGGSRTASPRQQTLRAAIAWSYELLSDAEKSVLRQAAVLRGSWTLEAIDAVWHDERFDDRDVLDLVGALVDKSLFVVEEGEDENRYRLLESTRDFAAECLDEAGEREIASDRHCAWFMARAEELDESYWRISGEHWYAGVQRELENFRGAVNWALEAAGYEKRAAMIVTALRLFWYNMARSEGRRLLKKIAEVGAGITDDLMRGRLALSEAIVVDSPTEGLAAARDARQLLSAGNKLDLRLEALIVLAQAVANQAGFSEAMELSESAISEARRASTPRQLGWALSSAAYVFACGGDLERARGLFDEAEPIVRRGKDSSTLARLQLIRSEVLFADGDASGALACARDAESIYRELRLEQWLCVILLNETAYLLSLGETAEALRAVREAVTLARTREDELALAVGIGHLARIAAETRRAETGATLLGYTDAFYARVGSVREPTEQHGYDRARELVDMALGKERVEALMREGAAMDERSAFEAAKAV